MGANQLIFSRSGSAKFYTVSPLLFGQKKLNNKYFLPDGRDLPEHVELRFWTFDFGFSDPSAAIAPYDKAFFGLPAGRNFLAVSMNQASVPQPTSTGTPAAGNPGALVTPAFLVNFLHTHEGAQRQWSNKDEFDVEAAGDGRLPYIFKSPVLILQGDTLTCSVTNLSNCTLQAQVMIAGGEF